MKVSNTGIELSDAEALSCDVDVIDVLIDGHRIWSYRVKRTRQGDVAQRIDWPPAIRKKLTGSGDVELTDSATQRSLATGHATFDTSDKPFTLTDSLGRWLALDKWGRLGPVLEGRDDGAIGRLLSSAQEAVAVLRELGLPVYIVGGSLLGYTRTGGMLPHDDDIDLAYLSDETQPIPLMQENFRISQALEDAGITVVRHSYSHLELIYFTDDGDTDYYIDVFTGFFHGGTYNQPFALRGPEISRDDLVPTTNVTIDGYELPAPARPEKWLEFAYGPGWRVPDPSFQFITPRSTKIRFEPWFGIFNRSRVYWEKHYLAQDAPKLRAGGREAVANFLSLLPPHANVLDLGCGDGSLTELIAAAGHSVIGIDYSYEALRLARANSQGTVEYRFVNALQRAEFLQFGCELLASGKTWYVFANGTLQSFATGDYPQIYLFLRFILRGDGFAYLTNDVKNSTHHLRSDPETWAYGPRNFDVYEQYGLSAEIHKHGSRHVGSEHRATVGAIVRRAPGSELSERTLELLLTHHTPPAQGNDLRTTDVTMNGTDA